MQQRFQYFLIWPRKSSSMPSKNILNIAFLCPDLLWIFATAANIALPMLCCTLTAETILWEKKFASGNKTNHENPRYHSTSGPGPRVLLWGKDKLCVTRHPGLGVAIICFNINKYYYGFLKSRLELGSG